MSAQVEIFEEIAYLYDGTLEGLLCAIFKAYAEHENPTDVWPEDKAQPRLMQRTAKVITDIDIAQRVRRGLINKAGFGAFSAVRSASVSSDDNAATIAYRFVRYAMDEHNGRLRPLSNISHPAVEPLVKICKSVSYECEHMRQFIRFEHMSGSPGIWFAKCNPKHSVVPLIMEHFVERFNVQPFIIYDEVHRICGVYEGKGWQLVKVDGELDFGSTLVKATDEIAIQNAWKAFYHAVNIDSRYHPELRRQFMPKRLWENITEVRDET